MDILPTDKKEIAADSLFDGRFLIEKLLGEGGMGKVFLARQEDVGRTVALKVMKTGFQTDELARFKREAQILSDLTHPNIVRVYSFGIGDGQPYLVMELLDGISVSTVLAQQERLTGDETLSICAQIADALALVHEKGIIHRDIKPSNIVVQRSDSGWQAKLTDFGIARQFSSAGITGTGDIIGTPAYMSPEQSSGSQLTGAADIYSLGCCLYEFLSGQPPFSGDSALEVISKHATAPAPALPQNTEASKGIRYLIELCLAKAPGSRPPAAALRDFACQLASPSQAKAATAELSRLLQLTRQQTLATRIKHTLLSPGICLPVTAVTAGALAAYLCLPVSLPFWQSLQKPLERLSKDGPVIGFVDRVTATRMKDSGKRANETLRAYNRAIRAYNKSADLELVPTSTALVPSSLILERSEFARTYQQQLTDEEIFGILKQQADYAAAIPDERVRQELVKLTVEMMRSSAATAERSENTQESFEELASLLRVYEKLTTIDNSAANNFLREWINRCKRACGGGFCKNAAWGILDLSRRGFNQGAARLVDELTRYPATLAKTYHTEVASYWLQFFQVCDYFEATPAEMELLAPAAAPLGIAQIKKHLHDCTKLSNAAKVTLISALEGHPMPHLPDKSEDEVGTEALEHGTCEAELANIFLDKQQLEKAREHWLKSLHVLNEIPAADRQKKIFWRYASAYDRASRRLGEKVTAEQLLGPRLESSASQSKDDGDQSSSRLVKQGKFFLNHSNYSLAIESIDRALVYEGKGARQEIVEKGKRIRHDAEEAQSEFPNGKDH